MKKFILTILLMISPVYAFNNSVIISQETVKSINVKNPEILEAKPIFTIENDKKYIIISPKTQGETELEVKTTSGIKIIKIMVKNNKILIKKTNGFEIYNIDTPPNYISIPKPPKTIEIPEPPKGGQ